MLPRHLFAVPCLAVVACTGPVTHVHNGEGHAVFVDGVQVVRRPRDRSWLAFRYYGTGRWDALPADRDGRPDWTLAASGGPIDKPAPVSPWVFPLDFPLELLRLWMVGPTAHHVHADLPRTPPEAVAPDDVMPPSMDELAARAEAARVQR